MGIGALNYQGVKGGLKLNDVIEEFKYAYKGQEIKAGDFVNYINGVASGSIGTDINAQVSDWRNSQAIEIDENRILIAYNNLSEMNILKCQIYSLENAQLIAGTTYSITSPTTYDLWIYDIAMLEDKRFVILGQSYNSDESIYYPLLFCGKVEGNTIIFGTAKSYLSNYPGYNPCSLCYISNNKFIMGSVFEGNNKRVNCHIFSISDLTLPSSFTSVYNPSYYYCSNLRIRKISDTKVLIVWNNTSKSSIYTTTGTISNNTLSTSTVRTITSSTDYLRNALSLSENLNLIIRTENSLPIISTYTTSIVSSNLLNTTDIPKIISMAGDVGVLKTSENSIILAYGGTSDVNYSVAILPITNITENSATIGTTYLYPSTSKVIRNIINFQTDIIALLSSYQDPSSNFAGSSYLNLFSIGETISNQIIQADYEQQVKIATEPPFDALALSSGVGGDDTGHNEQVKIAKSLNDYDLINYTIQEGEVITKGEEVEREVVTLIQGDIVPKTWEQVTEGTEYVAEDGTKISANAYTDTYTANKAFDGDSSSCWMGSASTLEDNLIIEFPKAVKITKIKTKISYGTVPNSIQLKGYASGKGWLLLYDFPIALVNELTEFTLNNADYYTKYKFLGNHTSNTRYSYFVVYEFQTSEYEGAYKFKGTALQSGTAGDTIQIAVPKEVK